MRGSETPVDTDTARQVAVARTCIALAGETDNLNWWNSSAGSAAGQFALAKIAPRNTFETAIRIALEAAKLRHLGMLGRAEYYHLFDFGSDIELLLQSHSSSGIAPPEGLSGKATARIASIEELQATLIAETGIDRERIRRVMDVAPNGGMLELDTVNVSSIACGDGLTELALDLACGYLAGAPGSLVIPVAGRAD